MTARYPRPVNWADVLDVFLAVVLLLAAPFLFCILWGV